MNLSPQACVDRFQARLCSLLDNRNRCKRIRARARGPIDLLTARPTLPVKTILWLFGRPWDGSRGWPNCFPFELSTRKDAEPFSIVLEARTRFPYLPWATRLKWNVRAQLSILILEILSRLAGRRGKFRQNSPNPPYSPAEIAEHQAASDRELEAILESIELPPPSVSRRSPPVLTTAQGE